MIYILIGYDGEQGEAIDGTILDADTDKGAVAIALDWVAFDAADGVAGWRLFAYSDSWAPGREVKPSDEDYR